MAYKRKKQSQVKVYGKTRAIKTIARDIRQARALEERTQEQRLDAKVAEQRRISQLNRKLQLKRELKAKGTKFKSPEKLSQAETERLEYDIKKKLKREEGTWTQRQLAKVGLSKEKGGDISRQIGRKELRAELTKAQLGRAFVRGEGAKTIKIRERAVRGTLTAMGIVSGKQTYAGAGRPRGSYIHGMPIAVWKAQQKQKERQRQEYQQDQYQKLASRGFTPEQVQQLQQQQTMEELQQPTQPQAVQQLQAREQRLQMLRQAQAGQIPQEQYPQQVQQNQNVMRQRYAQDMPFQNPSDEDLEFTRWRAEKTVSPNTQRMLTEVRRIQLLGKTSNIEHERRLRERKMMSQQLNLMRAHENMTPFRMDFTGVSEDNILMAPSIWKENPENNILRPRGTSILNTQNGGNNLKFF